MKCTGTALVWDSFGARRKGRLGANNVEVAHGNRIVAAPSDQHLNGARSQHPLG